MFFNSMQRSTSLVPKARSFKPLIFVLCGLLVLAGCGKKGDGENVEESNRYLKSAVAYSDQGQYRAAILEIKNSIQKSASNQDSYLLLAQIYNKIGAVSNSQKMLESVKDRKPALDVELAQSYFFNGKYRSLLTVLEPVDDAKLNVAEQVKKYSLIGKSGIRLGDKAALDLAVNALKKIPNGETELKLIQAEGLIAQGNMQEAQAIIDSITNIDNDVKSLIVLGQFAMQQNQLTKSEDLLTKALTQLPNTDVMTVEKTTVLSQLTEVLIRSGRTGEAYRYQKLLAESNPESQQAQQKYNDALELYKQGKFTEATTMLKELREQFPQDKNSAMLLGMIQFQQGQDGNALEIFDKFIDPETASTPIIQAAAIAKYRANKMDDAIVLLKKAVESQPNNSEVLATYGLALLDKDPKSVEAEKLLEKSLAINPKQQRIRLALAKRNLAEDKPIQALAQLQKAYTETPKDLVISQAYFRQLLSMNKLEEVKKEIAQYQKDYPNESRGFFFEGWFKLSQKDYVGAQVSFEKALSIKGSTEKVLSYAGLAQIYEAQKLPQKALVAWQGLVEADPSQLEAYAHWFAQVKAQGQIKDGIQFLQKLEKTSEAWQPDLVLAQIYFDESRHEEGLPYITKAIEKSNKSEQVKQIAANLYQGYGVFLQKSGKADQAKTYFMRSLSAYPNNMGYLANMIQLEISTKNIPEAKKLLEQFSGGAEFEAEHDYLQGIILDAEGDKTKAIATFEQSWNKKPLEATAEILFAFYQKSNEKEKSAKFLDAWVEKIPRSIKANFLKATAAQENKDQAEAQKWYEKTLALSPNIAAALNNLAWIYYEQKNPKAIELARRAYQLAPNGPEILDTYGWILVEEGKVSEGLEILEKAKQLAPTNKEIGDHYLKAKSKLK